MAFGVAAVLLLDLLEAMLASLRIRLEACRMRPPRACLQCDDARRRGGEHGAVVTHVEDRHRTGADPFLEPVFALDVEEIVRLVQQQHVEVGAEEDLQREPLALSAGERLGGALRALRVTGAEGRAGAPVPHDLHPVTAGVLPRGEGIRVRELNGVGGAGREGGLGGEDPRTCRSDLPGCVRQQELPHRRGLLRADELAHQAHPSGDIERSRRGLLQTGDESQERGLPDAVGSDEGGVMAFRNPERHALEEGPPSGQSVRGVDKVDHGHGDIEPTPSPGRLSWQPGEESSGATGEARV
jgi:hypothetical protein